MNALLVLAALTLALGCGAIRSTIGIESQTQFVLGGEQAGPFRAEVVNVGPTLIEVFEVTAEGDTLAVGRLGPGASASAQFRAGSRALFVNRSGREGAVQAVVRGDTGLGMGYAPVGDG